VVQEDLEELRGPTGRVIVRSPDVDRAVAVLDGRVERVEGDTLLVAEADSAALNLRLVAGGVRVTEIGPERRSLEKLVLAVTGSGSDRIDRAGGDAGRGADDHAGGDADDHAGTGADDHAGRGADDHAGGDGTAQAEGGDPGDPG
jgi:ABC-2 type transport system ATP-binding protein